MLCDKIKEVAKEKKIPIYKIEKECGFASGSISRWNDVKPSYDKVCKVATYLGVPVTRLME